MAEFKDRLEEALSLRGMKPSELAKKTGIGEGAISQYRKGAYKASQRNLEKISKALDFSIPWLMGISDDPNRAMPTNLLPLPEFVRNLASERSRVVNQYSPWKIQKLLMSFHQTFGVISR